MNGTAMSAGKGTALTWRWWRRPAAVDAAPVGATADVLQARYLDVVFRYVARRVPAAQAEDVTADVFAAAFDALHRCPAPAADGAEDDPARAWLLAIARRKVADAHRRRGRRPEESLDSLPVEALPLAEAGDGPEPTALRAERACVLRGILEGLSPEMREALLLKYADGLSQAEVARVLGRSPAATNSLLQRARAAVRERGHGYFLGDDGAARREGDGEEGSTR